MPPASRCAQDQANPACPRRFWRRKSRVSPLWHIARTGLFLTWSTLGAPAPIRLMRSLTGPVCSQLLTEIAHPQQTFPLRVTNDRSAMSGHVGLSLSLRPIAFRQQTKLRARNRNRQPDRDPIEILEGPETSSSRGDPGLLALLSSCRSILSISR